MRGFVSLLVLLSLAPAWASPEVLTGTLWEGRTLQTDSGTVSLELPQGLAAVVDKHLEPEYEPEAGLRLGLRCVVRGQRRGSVFEVRSVLAIYRGRGVQPVDWHDRSKPVGLLVPAGAKLWVSDAGDGALQVALEGGRLGAVPAAGFEFGGRVGRATGVLRVSDAYGRLVFEVSSVALLLPEGEQAKFGDALADSLRRHSGSEIQVEGLATWGEVGRGWRNGWRVQVSSQQVASLPLNEGPGSDPIHALAEKSLLHLLKQARDMVGPANFVRRPEQAPRGWIGGPPYSKAGLISVIAGIPVQEVGQRLGLEEASPNAGIGPWAPVVGSRAAKPKVVHLREARVGSQAQQGGRDRLYLNLDEGGDVPLLGNARLMALLRKQLTRLAASDSEPGTIRRGRRYPLLGEWVSSEGGQAFRVWAVGGTGQWIAQPTAGTTGEAATIPVGRPIFNRELVWISSWIGTSYAVHPALGNDLDRPLNEATGHTDPLTPLVGDELAFLEVGHLVVGGYGSEWGVFEGTLLATPWAGGHTMSFRMDDGRTVRMPAEGQGEAHTNVATWTRRLLPFEGRRVRVRGSLGLSSPLYGTRWTFEQPLTPADVTVTDQVSAEVRVSLQSLPLQELLAEARQAGHAFMPDARGDYSRDELVDALLGDAGRLSGAESEQGAASLTSELEQLTGR